MNKARPVKKRLKSPSKNLREMAAVVEDVANNVGQAASSAEGADQEAKSGKHVVTATMGQIESLARDIVAAAEVSAGP